MFNKKGQTSGLITGLIFGIASLIIGVVIAFIIVSTLIDSELLTGGRGGATVTNETLGWLNSTGYQLTGLDANFVPGGITLTAINNGTDVFLLANASVNATGFVVNTTEVVFNIGNFSYTNVIFSNEELATKGLSANFTKGIDNVSSKIPTVLLIAAIVMILGVLALLVATWRKMNIGGGSI